MPTPTITCEPLTPERWPDLAQLFGPRGACAGCWDMWWRLKRSEFDRQKGDGNRAAFEALVRSGVVPGLLTYVDGVPAGWCAIQPRDAYPALDRSRILARVDDRPVWSVTCFYVTRPHRRQLLTVRLLEATISYAQAHGAEIIEGYPISPKDGASPDAFVFTGLLSAFQQAGFVEVARRSPTRPIMRYVVSE